ncbi:MAG: hypothetical protein PSV35_04890 [bacterium]|nr:hypothetical protein [bacterium]
MPSNMTQKINAGIILSTSILLGEYLKLCNEQENFELTNLYHPRALPLWLLENGISYIGYCLPKTLALSLKILLPLVSLNIILQMEHTESLENNPGPLVGANPHALFNVRQEPFIPFLGEPHRMDRNVIG